MAYSSVVSGQRALLVFMRICEPARTGSTVGRWFVEAIEGIL